MPRLLLLALVLAACGGDPAPREAAPPVREVAAPIDSVIQIPGGTTRVGVLDGEAGMPHERPAFSAEIDSFGLDRSPVTVARFRAFVDATGHETQAEAFGDGALMDPGTGAWSLVPGADWRTPRGPAGGPAPEAHPVTQVSHADAEAYCAWDGDRRGLSGRLPTEPEWEHAARGASDDRSPYAWGDALDEGGQPRANTWTGTFPGGDDGADGYRSGTNPVGAFGETPLGLTDMGGNVWEWTASWYRPYPLTGAEGDPPAGPSGAPERVQRGGSFLCHPSYCHGYRVSARGHSTPESSFAHVGFRCAYGAG